MARTSVSFVIPTFRRPDALRTALEAVLAVEHSSASSEVIVVHNAGGRATEEVVRRHAGSSVPVRYVVESRGGVARARNHGARVAGGELLILLDDDSVVEPFPRSRPSKDPQTLWRLSGRRQLGLRRRHARRAAQSPFGRLRSSMALAYVPVPLLPGGLT